LREKMRQRGYEQVKKFSWNNSAESIIAAYEQVAGVRSSTTPQHRVANS
jgi:glycosyltransferase involved in cell wall biosynthesis